MFTKARLLMKYNARSSYVMSSAKWFVARLTRMGSKLGGLAWMENILMFELAFAKI